MIDDPPREVQGSIRQRRVWVYARDIFSLSSVMYMFTYKSYEAVFLHQAEYLPLGFIEGMQSIYEEEEVDETVVEYLYMTSWSRSD